MVLHYRIEQKLGQGGMGVVYKAIDTKLQRYVAIKFLLGHYDENSPKTKRFWEEARSVAQLTHGNIMGIHHLETHDVPFLVMSYIDGVSLKKILENKTFTVSETVKCVAKIAQAIHYAHQQGVIHRDLKPENIMIAKNGEPIIMDFGLAKRLESDTKISRAGDIFGTPHYMSPEQAKGENSTIDHRTDIFSLGVILYEMLTQSLPFKGDSLFVIIRQTVEQDPTPPHELNAKISLELENVCLKALAKSRENRYSSGEEFANHLYGTVSLQERSTPKKTIRKIRKVRKTVPATNNKKLLPIGIGMGVLLVLLLGFSFSGQKTSSNVSTNHDVGNKTNTLTLFEEYMNKGEKAFVEKQYATARSYLQLALEQQQSEKAIALIEAIDLAGKKLEKTLELFIDSPIQEIKTNQNVWIVRGRVTGEIPRVFCLEKEAIVKNNQFELHLPLDGEGKKKYDIVATDKNGKREQRTVNFILDKTPPKLSVDAPKVTIEEKVTIGAHVQENNPWTVRVNNKVLSKIEPDSFSFTHALVPGDNTVIIDVEDIAGNVTRQKVLINYSAECPPPKILFPKKDNFVTKIKNVRIACVANPLYERVYVNKKVASLLGKRFVRKINLSLGENSIIVMANDRFGRKSHTELKIYREKGVRDRKEKAAEENTKKEEINISEIIEKNFHATRYEFSNNNFVKMTYIFNSNYECLQDFDITPNTVTVEKNYLQITTGPLVMGMVNKFQFKGDVAVEVSVSSDSLIRVYSLGICHSGLAAYTFEINENKKSFVLRKGIGALAPTILPEMNSKLVSTNKNRIFTMNIIKKGELISGYYKKRKLFAIKNSEREQGKAAIFSFFATKLKVYKFTVAGYIDQEWLQKLR